MNEKYFVKENYSEARQALLDYLARKPETEKVSSQVYLMLGFCYYKEGEKEEARKVFKQVYEIYPDNIALLAYYASTSYETKHYQEASQLFERYYDKDNNKNVRRLEYAAQSSIEIKK